MNNTSSPLFLPGDKIYYTGEKYKDRLNGKPGWIHAPVNGSDTKFVVEFPDTRNSKDQEDTDDYVMHASLLSKWRPEKDPKEKKQEGPEIQPRRKRRDQEEE
jgi:hypothetical protein